jgi:hypothetical protein
VSHECTPPWPRQAPDLVVPENADPSLQVAVTAGAWACDAKGSNNPAIAITKAK